MGPVKLSAPLVSILVLTGCAAGPIFPAAGFPPAEVSEPARPSVAAYLGATPEGSTRSGDESRSCLRVDLANTLSPGLVLQSLQVELDGALQYVREAPSGGRRDLAFTRAFTVFLGQAAPGPHELLLSAWLEINPRDALGSTRGAGFGRCSRYRFTVAAGGAIRVTASLSNEEDGYPPIPERLTVSYAEDRDAQHPGQREPQDAGEVEGRSCPRAARP